jgi:glycosyltransferase involved in cell wall biosynthesis
MLAWRDNNHPKKGGAEVVTDIYLKGLAKNHDVTLFTAKYDNSKNIELFNGYKILRKGNALSVYFHGLMYAYKNNYDVVIDQVNTIPFFTPLLINKKKRVGFFHQLARDVWFHETKFPLSVVGNVLEWIYLKLYHNTKCIVVSNSTKKDLEKYAGTKDILVLDNQIDFKPINKVGKKENCFVYCGRLKKSKRVHDIILAMKNVNSKLYIIGSGDDDYLLYLKKLITENDLGNKIIFTGRVSDKKRNDIMRKSQAIIVASIREGWGLIVTEANANGTTAITYDVPGLRDANMTGIVTPKNNPNELTIAMNTILNDKGLMMKMSKDSLEFAREHSDWDGNVRLFEEYVVKK